jgi:hypothetical protein
MPWLLAFSDVCSVLPLLMLAQCLLGLTGNGVCCSSQHLQNNSCCCCGSCCKPLSLMLLLLLLLLPLLTHLA